MYFCDVFLCVMCRGTEDLYHHWDCSSFMQWHQSPHHIYMWAWSLVGPRELHFSLHSVTDVFQLWCERLVFRHGKRRQQGKQSNFLDLKHLFNLLFLSCLHILWMWSTCIQHSLFLQSEFWSFLTFYKPSQRPGDAPDTLYIGKLSIWWSHWGLQMAQISRFKREKKVSNQQLWNLCDCTHQQRPGEMK